MTEFNPPALKEYSDIPPPVFTEEKGGKYILDELSRRSSWQERPLREGTSDPILFINLQSGRQYTFDGATLKTSPLEDIQNHGVGFNGVIIVTGSMTNGDRDVARTLLTGFSLSKPGGAVAIFEKPEGDLKSSKNFVEKDWRIDDLKNAGFVGAEVLNSGRSVAGSILWEGHVPRDGGLKEPVDLLENGPFYIDPMIAEMKKMYQEQGWDVVDFENSELASKLRKSKFPLKDIHAIRDGFGVKVKSNQCPTSTCEGVIPIDTGNIELINSCGEEHVKPETVDPKTKAVESKTNISVRKTVKHKDGEVEILERNCIYCGNHLRATYFREGKGPQQMQISCPSDGFVELRNAG